MTREQFRVGDELKKKLDRLEEIWRFLSVATNRSEAIKESLEYALDKLEQEYIVKLKCGTRQEEEEIAMPEKRYITRIQSSDIKLDGSRKKK